MYWSEGEWYNPQVGSEEVEGLGMLCQKCHKNLASVRYAEVVDGKVSDLHLCQDCLKAQQEDEQTGFELSEPSPFANRLKSSALAQAATSTETCKSCSTSLSVIIETGKVGCAACYESFPAQIESVMEGIHIALTHRGKIPKLDDSRAQARSELQSKRALLKTALSLENYEDAAALRDEIRSLETGLGVSVSGVE